MRTDEFISRIGMPDHELKHVPGAETRTGRVHNWVIFVDEQPVGLISAQIQDQPRSHSPLNRELDDPADYPLLGTVTYIDRQHRSRGYASAAKHAISEHVAAAGVQTFGCIVAGDNPQSLRSISRAGYERVHTEKVDGKPDKLYFRRRR
ncbi:GNAT family N-acetyltransferase [Nocardia elegans]|uniref:GNAT family N-acetyltransferase n=1 Tax=Nocardia TaxID=1817 RepID=UPI0018937D04|nr:MULTISPECIES: GNAT family N-acetyltransferase [Nocardia]MBF6246361.1 GNAT family N-acetyltransferase [Nocardia elegans]